jgi:hypothetical protein
MGQTHRSLSKASKAQLPASSEASGSAACWCKEVLVPGAGQGGRDEAKVDRAKRALEKDWQRIEVRRFVVVC